MKTNTLLVRTAALSALLVLQACSSGMQASQAEHDPWELYKLGSVYDCDQVGAPDQRVNPQNLPTPGYGCAHQSNITLMVADPEDLHRARPSTPADTTSRQRVLEAYREGSATGTGTGVQGTQGLIE